MKSIPETPCTGCGELVPENCVRCRECGSFLRPEMEKHYERLREKERPVIDSRPRPGEDNGSQR